MTAASHRKTVELSSSVVEQGELLAVLLLGICHSSDHSSA